MWDVVGVDADDSDGEGRDSLCILTGHCMASHGCLLAIADGKTVRVRRVCGVEDAGRSGGPDVLQKMCWEKEGVVRWVGFVMDGSQIVVMGYDFVALYPVMPDAVGGDEGGGNAPTRVLHSDSNPIFGSYIVGLSGVTLPSGRDGVVSNWGDWKSGRPCQWVLDVEAWEWIEVGVSADGSSAEGAVLPNGCMLMAKRESGDGVEMRWFRPPPLGEFARRSWESLLEMSA